MLYVSLGYISKILGKEVKDLNKIAVSTWIEILKEYPDAIGACNCWESFTRNQKAMLCKLHPSIVFYLYDIAGINFFENIFAIDPTHPEIQKNLARFKNDANKYFFDFKEAKDDIFAVHLYKTHKLKKVWFIVFKEYCNKRRDLANFLSIAFSQIHESPDGKKEKVLTKFVVESKFLAQDGTPLFRVYCNDYSLKEKKLLAHFDGLPRKINGIFSETLY